MARPSLRFAYFTHRPPTPVPSEVPGSDGALHEGLRITIDPRVGPEPADPIRFWLLVGLLGAFGQHRIDCRLRDPQGVSLWSSTALSNARHDKGWLWTSAHEMVFLPLLPGSYPLEVLVDGEAILNRAIDVEVDPEARSDRYLFQRETSVENPDNDDEFSRFKKLPLVGIPGIPQAKVMSLRFAAGDPRNDEGPEGTPGKYRVTFTLSRPGMRPSGEYQLAFERQMSGHSHLALAAPLVIVDATPDGQPILAHCLPNDEGFLGKIVIEELHATSFADAERKSYSIANAALTHLGVLFDIPLHIFQCDVEEQRTGKTKIRFVAPYPATQQLLEASAKGPTKELQACASFYREALISTSVLYQYLCYFKVVESVLVVRKRAERKAADSGEMFARPEERFPTAPDTAWLDCLYYTPPKWDTLAVEAVFIAPVLGRAFAELLSTEMRQLRNEITHAIAESTSDLTSADDMELQYRAVMWMPPLKIMARRMLKNAFAEEFLVGLHDAVTVDAAQAVSAHAATPPDARPRRRIHKRAERRGTKGRRA